MNLVGTLIDGTLMEGTFICLKLNDGKKHLKKYIDIAIKNTRSVNGSVPDVVLSKETNHLIDSTVESEQISTSKMMKIKVYFWFEGWDADCMGAINNSIVNINLGFMTNNDDEE